MLVARSAEASRGPRGTVPTPQSCQTPALVTGAHFQPRDSGLVPVLPARPCAMGLAGSSSRSLRRGHVPPAPPTMSSGQVLMGDFAPSSCQVLTSVWESLSFKPLPVHTSLGARPGAAGWGNSSFS